MSNIRDASLAPSGRKKIEWVRSFMPALSVIEKQFEQERPFEGLRVAVSVHLEAKTANLGLVLAKGGARVFLTGCNPLSTQDDVAAAIAGMGEETFGKYGVSEQEYEDLLAQTLSCHPHLIVDDGGDLINLLGGRCREYADCLIGGCEETTTGIHRLRAREREGILPCPMMAVNDAKAKHYYDNKYGTGQSVWTAIMDTTNLIVAGKTVVVARIMPMDEAARYGDIFVTVTGCKDVITEKHFRVMKDQAVLCNAGHFDCEVDVAWLRDHAVRAEERRKNIIGYTLEDGRTLNVLGEGRLVNLACGMGHPAEIMDMSFAVQALSLKWLAEHRDSLETRVYDVPDSIDDEIGRCKLAAMGLAIDRLTPDQEAYLNGWTAQ